MNGRGGLESHCGIADVTLNRAGEVPNYVNRQAR